MNNERAENDFIERGFVTNLNKDPPYLVYSLEHSSFPKQISKPLLFSITHRSQN